MSMPKKSLLACVSAAALVASIGFVQAQSPDEGAYPNANVNGTTDHGMDPRAYPADRLPANNNDDTASYDAGAAQAPSDSAAPVAPSDPSVATAPDPVMTATAPSPGMAGEASAVPAPADTAAPVPAPASNLTVTDAPETRIDLSPPSEPLYNLPGSGMRAPRPDRN